MLKDTQSGVAAARENAAVQNRRRFLQMTAAAGIAAATSSRRAFADATTLPVTQPAVPTLARFPEKTDLILLTDRPPNLETPLKYFRLDYTPNDAFFVRWHLGIVPTSVDLETFQLSITGHVQEELSFTVAELRKEFEAFSVVAVNQCSGNSRSYFEPRVPGGQWGNGAMGNAKWTGVRLRDLLQKAKPKDKALEVSFQGLDRAPMPSVPAFVKTLSFEHATGGEVMVAYEMNGKPLPMLNGFPLRLVVPGWYATYWVKSLNDIRVLSEPFHGFWMEKAYRVPKNYECEESPTALAKETIPINTMTVRSLFVRPEPGVPLTPAADGRGYEVEGLALDSGKGIRKVELSSDGGKTWVETALDPEIGKYSWRRWRYRLQPAGAARLQLMVKATNAAGETQPTAQWNRNGYARNVIETLDVTFG